MKEMASFVGFRPNSWSRLTVCVVLFHLLAHRLFQENLPGLPLNCIDAQIMRNYTSAARLMCHRLHEGHGGSSGVWCMNALTRKPLWEWHESGFYFEKRFIAGLSFSSSRFHHICRLFLHGGANGTRVTTRSPDCCWSWVLPPLILCQQRKLCIFHFLFSVMSFCNIWQPSLALDHQPHSPRRPRVNQSAGGRDSFFL